MLRWKYLTQSFDLVDTLGLLLGRLSEARFPKIPCEAVCELEDLTQTLQNCKHHHSSRRLTGSINYSVRVHRLGCVA